MLESLLILSGLKRRWPVVSAEDVLLHNDRDSLWIVCGNSVFDLTTILGIHPGGDAALLRRGGGLRDCTEDYHFHSRYARKEWDRCKIGELVAEEAEKLPRFVSASGPTKNMQSSAGAVDCFQDGSSNSHASSNSSTFTVETIPSTSVTPGHYRLRDEPRAIADFARPRANAATLPKPPTQN